MYTSVWTFNESLVVTVFANLTPVSSGLRSLNTGRSASLPRHPASISGISSASLAAWCGQSVPEVFFRMNKKLPISRVINLISEESQRLWTSDESEARRRLLASDPSAVLQLDGSFAIVAQDGERVVLARSLDRPLRYFLAKAVDGPVLVVAERIHEIAAELPRPGWSDPVHPTYSRMVPAHHVTTLRAVAVSEDYKPLDVECAAANIALLAGIRERYPEWRLLVDGDGGDENLKDYPIEANSELTIRSVVNNRMLYQEGWGVDSIKHSLTYSGGYSRGCVRSYACAREFGFDGFSPYTRPSVIAVAEAIPFAELTQGSHERLYELKGEIVSRGVRAVLGLEMPVFPKRRFQHGSVSAKDIARLFPQDEARYRRHFEALHSLETLHTAVV